MPPSKPSPPPRLPDRLGRGPTSAASSPIRRLLLKGRRRLPRVHTLQTQTRPIHLPGAPTEGVRPTATESVAARPRLAGSLTRVTQTARSNGSPTKGPKSTGSGQSNKNGLLRSPKRLRIPRKQDLPHPDTRLANPLFPRSNSGELRLMLLLTTLSDTLSSIPAPCLPVQHHRRGRIPIMVANHLTLLPWAGIPLLTRLMPTLARLEARRLALILLIQCVTPGLACNWARCLLHHRPMRQDTMVLLKAPCIPTLRGSVST